MRLQARRRGRRIGEDAVEQPDAADEAGAAAGRLAPSSQLIRVLGELRERRLGPSMPDPGFAIAADVLAAAEVAAVAEAIGGVSLRSRAGARHLMSVPAVRALASDTRLLDLARRTLGPTALPYRATLFDKSPRSN